MSDAEDKKTEIAMKALRDLKKRKEELGEIVGELSEWERIENEIAEQRLSMFPKMREHLQKEHPDDKRFKRDYSQRYDDMSRHEIALNLPKLLFRGTIVIPRDGKFYLIDPCYLPRTLPDKNADSVCVQTNWKTTRAAVYVLLDDESRRPERVYVTTTDPAQLGIDGDEPYIRAEGHVGVDSGQVIILNGDKFEHWVDGGFSRNETNDYNNACNLTLYTAEGGGWMFGNSYDPYHGLGYVSRTNWGDGGYPVYYRSTDFFVDFTWKFRKDEDEDE